MTMGKKYPKATFCWLSFLCWFGIIISSCTPLDASSISAGSSGTSNLRSAATEGVNGRSDNSAAAAATTTTNRNLIIGGSDAAEGRFPSYVALVNSQDGIECGGTLIAPDVVLTAAHCKASNLKYALVGKYWYDVSVTTDGYERIEILDPTMDMDASLIGSLTAAGSAIIDPAGFIHPKNNLKELTYDVMLLKLASPSSHPLMKVNFDPYVPVKQSGNEIVVVGLGRIEVSGPSATVLQQVYLNYLPYDECIDAAAYNVDYKFEILPDMICTLGKGLYGVRGQCYGDSGGPYMVVGDTSADDIQVGVVSWAINCASPVFPMVGSRTSASADFIRGVTCAISSSPPAEFCAAPTSYGPQYVTVTDGVQVSVRIYSDPYPSEISWKITDVSGQLVYMSVDYGGIVGDYSNTAVMLPPGQDFVFLIQDAADDGIFGDPDATLYEVVLVDQGVNMVLAKGNGEFTTSRSQTFTVPLSSEYPAASPESRSSPIVDTSLIAGRETSTVIIYIKFADYSEDLSWKVTDAADASKVYASVPPDHYRYGVDAWEQIQLPSGSFNFTVTDRRGTDDLRALQSFSISYVDDGGSTVSLVADDRAVFYGETETNTFVIPSSGNVVSNGSGQPAQGEVTVCLATFASCNQSSDCCTGRCASGQCRSSTRNGARDSLRIGTAYAGGAASRANAQDGK